MKIITAACVLVALSSLSPAKADWKDDIFTDISRTAPRGVHVDLGIVARTVFGDIRDQAPVKAPDRVDDGFTGE